jgi:CDP-diacylglycerol--glycerol-3-phosphate 3-phosphatidyltransferase
MTVANQITIFRILLIPVFVLFCVYYGSSVESGTPAEWMRLAAIAAFVLAAATDGIDGYIARHWNQRTRLGAVLDPIADKGLLVTAIITLSLSNWNERFPLWFPVLVIARDALILCGCGVLYLLNHGLEVKPTWTGKTATAAQMVAIAWLMLKIPNHEWGVYLAGFITLLSAADYLVRGIGQLRAHNHPV